MIRWIVGIILFFMASPAMSTTYYMAPTGSNANDGLTPSTPFLTFAYAINVARASCGDTLILRNGTYGDGTTTGKIDINGLACAAFDELTIRAENQRQAKIVDNGTGYAVRVRNSSHFIIDGLYGRSTDNNYNPGAVAELGEVFYMEGNDNYTLRNNICVNPNRYGNNHCYSNVYLGTTKPRNVLLEDNEAYVFHRHCVAGGDAENMVVRRQYCNPRGGRIPGGPAGTLGYADSLFSMYPCKDCILENSIADGTETPMFLNEMNANFHNSVVTTGNKILGSICYRCKNGNGIFINSRSVVGSLNHTPQNITIKDVAIVDYNSGSSAIRVSDCAGTLGCTVDHITLTATAAIAGARGVSTDDSAQGVSSASNIVAMTNIIAQGFPGLGLSVTGFATWSGDEIISYNNTTAFTPPLPSNWTNAVTTNPGLGTCKVYVPDGAAAKGAGTGGSDIGANILNRYVNGALTSTPLWDTVTGEFPHGAADPDGINRQPGTSIDSIHIRLNVNAGGCSFPAGYGGGGGVSTVVQGTTAASGLSTTATPLTWNHTIAASQDRLLVCVGLWHSGANVGSVSGIDVSGQAMTVVASQVTIPDFYRNVSMWQLLNPTAGVRTITVTLTGNISGALGRSMEFDVTSGLNAATGASTFGSGTSLSVTASTNTNELVTDCTVSSKSATFTHGTDQTGYDSLAHDTQSLRLEASTQSGSSGGVMSNATGGTVLQAKVAVSLVAGTPDPPTTATLTQSDYLFLYPFGTEAGAPPVQWWLADASAKNLPVAVHPNALVRVRALIAGSVDTTSPFGAALYCRQNADSYTKVTNDAGATTFRLYGASVNPDVPSHLSTTTARLCGSSCVPGAIVRDATAPFTVPALTVGQKLELDAVLQLVGASGTVDCRFQSDNGTAFDAYTNTAHMTIVPVAAGAP